MSKESIYEIPVNDAFAADTECPFCYMLSVLEKNTVDYMMGPSYMEDDIRMETNKIGFCQNHYRKMFGKQNSLGLALMLHTHLQQINKDLTKMLPSNGVPSITKKGFFSKPIIQNNVSSHLHKVHDDCYICKKIETTFVNYVDTFFYLWKRDNKFPKMVKECKGFCIEHFADIYETAPNKLSPSECEDFYKTIIPIQLENMKRLEEELSWFIDKFDYRYKDEPWKNSKDALPRSIQKVSSEIIE